MPEFTTDGLVRHGFGFYNPNHAAALICALAPFCWGWRGMWRWCGYAAFTALCAALAQTYSRAGMAVFAAEMAAWAVMKWRGSTRDKDGALWKTRPAGHVAASALAVAAIVAAAWWMRSRIAVDGAVQNRPRIWLAGLRLFAANPLGVGFGSSGKIASAFLLPDGMTVRTFVNSHLTLLAEIGVFVGGAWLVFVAAAIAAGWRRFVRVWLSFAGLAASAALGMKLWIRKHLKGTVPPGGWNEGGLNMGETHYSEPTIAYRVVNKGNGKIGYEVIITPAVSIVDVYFHPNADLAVSVHDEDEHVQWIIKYDNAIETFKREAESIVDCPNEAYLQFKIALDRLNEKKKYINNANDKLDSRGGPHGH